MNAMESRLPVETLSRLLRLDVETGRLFWLRRDFDLFPKGPFQSRDFKNWNARCAEKQAFLTRSSGRYFHGSIFGEKLLAHRVVFALFHGHWPVGTVDHINGDSFDNRPANLRDVPHIDNCRNWPLSKASSTGVTGVSRTRNRGQYEAYIGVRGRKITLGRFDDINAAAQARKQAEREHGFHPNHGRPQ